MKKRINLSKFKRETGIKVGDIMTREIVSVSPDTTVKDCVKEMFKQKTASIVVTKDNKLIGLVTKRDLLNSILKSKDPGLVKVKNIMTGRVKTIKPDLDLYKALILMRKAKIKKFPVVQKKKVIGFLTTKDIMKIQPQLFEHIAESMQIKEETEKLKRIDKLRSTRYMAGIEPRGNVEGPCEECGNYGWLEEIDGKLICANCR